jgi:hypothetical protein
VFCAEGIAGDEADTGNEENEQGECGRIVGLRANSELL